MDLIGFVQALLLNITIIAGINDPQTKVSPVGFMKMLMENNAITEINNIDALRGGQDHQIKLRYMQRGTEADVTTIDDCETPIVPEWKEATIERNMFSKIGIFISDADMRKYQAEATKTMELTNNGKNPENLTVPMMTALYKTIVVKVNGLIQHMDSQLVAAQATKWGANAAYNLAKTVQTINLGKTAELNDGVVKLLEDAQMNEIEGDLLVCGSGVISAYDRYQKLKGTDDSGIGSLPLNVYYDPKTASKWGKDHFGVFAKGLVGLVDWNKNVGDYAGDRGGGGSLFFTLPIPVTLANGTLTQLVLDAQLKYYDCPQYDEDNRLIRDRGWGITLSKHYGLFNAPEDVFGDNDVLKGVNGSLHYMAKDATLPAQAS